MAGARGYLFHHIPKCGGTSMRRVFEHILGTSNVLWVIDKDVSLPPAYFADWKMIGGHFPHVFGSYSHPDRFYITMIRHPIDRILSHYYFYKNNVPEKYNPIIKKIQNLSLDAFIHSDDPEVKAHSRNYQANIFAYLNPSLCNLTADELYRTAKEHIARFDFIGVYESFTDSIDFCCLQFGFPSILDIPWENTTKSRKHLSDLDQASLKTLTRLNEIDLELYEHVKSIFATKKRAILIDLINDNSESGSGGIGTRPRETSGISLRNIVDGREIESPHDFGDFSVEIVETFLTGLLSNAATVNAGEDVIVDVFMEAKQSIDNVTVGIMIKDRIGTVIFGTNSYHLNKTIAVERGKKYRVRFRFRVDLGLGDYFITVALHSGDTHTEHCYHWRESAIAFSVTDCNAPLFVGQARLYPLIEIDEVSSLNPFSAELMQDGVIGAMHVLEEVFVPVTIKNTSRETWLTQGKTPIRLSYHWFNSDGDIIVYDGYRTLFMQSVEPGGEVTLDARVCAPEQAGEFVLRLTLVQEGIAWFEDRGMKPLDIAVSVGYAGETVKGLELKDRGFSVRDGRA